MVGAAGFEPTTSIVRRFRTAAKLLMADKTFSGKIRQAGSNGCIWQTIPQAVGTSEWAIGLASGSWPTMALGPIYIGIELLNRAPGSFAHKNAPLKPVIQAKQPLMRNIRPELTPEESQWEHLPQRHRFILLNAPLGLIRFVRGFNEYIALNASVERPQPWSLSLDSIQYNSSDSCQKRCFSLTMARSILLCSVTKTRNGLARNGVSARTIARRAFIR